MIGHGEPAEAGLAMKKCPTLVVMTPLTSVNP